MSSLIYHLKQICVLGKRVGFRCLLSPIDLLDKASARRGDVDRACVTQSMETVCGFHLCHYNNDIRRLEADNMVRTETLQ